VSPSLSLAGRHVVIVGGSSGIGFATARCALAAGASIAVFSRNPDRAREAGLSNPRVEFRRVDILDSESVSQAFSPLGRIDHVFVSAGTVVPVPVRTSSLERLLHAFDERVAGALRVIQAALPHMDRGSVTLTSGDLVERPVAGLAPVGAAAAAVESLVKALSLELAPLRVNVVSPGAIDTELYAKMFGKQRAAAVEEQRDKVPIRRMGTAEDVAAAVIFLMTNAHMSGCILNIDGALRHA
jgi:NAD(P)-dependent dehydrogenase (short-subunit alcohol dehydrogenase family)